MESWHHFFSRFFFSLLCLLLIEYIHKLVTWKIDEYENSETYSFHHFLTISMFCFGLKEKGVSLYIFLTKAKRSAKEDMPGKKHHEISSNTIKKLEESKKKKKQKRI